jgi:hypothetical protein
MNNGKIVGEDGVTCWYLNDELHREDGPAIIYRDGDETWYLYGKKHRVDGPAVNWGFVKKWCFEEKKHRLDGPAVIYDDGDKEWWIDDVCLTKEEWWNSISEEMKIKALFNGEMT